MSLTIYSKTDKQIREETKTAIKLLKGMPPEQIYAILEQANGDEWRYGDWRIDIDYDLRGVSNARQLLSYFLRKNTPLDEYADVKQFIVKKKR